ncbi:MAG TPA: NUDIX domain-containing protein [Pyrinomonadaceae bacterium]|nr:NUDIX domain-containing protein [Pyrinomonadaceae bacterium]
MGEALTFGAREPGVEYTDRVTACVVIMDAGRVATVRSRGKHFLPGGGSLPGETPEETAAREVCEGLTRGVRIVRRLGEAVQYFYSESDRRHYRMRATFFAGEFTGEPCGDAAEHELVWLPLADAERECFHACHAWAAGLA